MGYITRCLHQSPGMKICNALNFQNLFSDMSNDYEISYIKVYTDNHGKLQMRDLFQT